jgi:adenine-specific DNA-methyltransferase
VWPSRSGRGGTVSKIQIGHEYIECVTRNKEQSNFKPTEKEIEEGNYSDEKGVYQRELLRQWGAQAQRRENRPSMYFPIPTPFGVDAFPKLPDGTDGRWRFGLKKVMKMLEDGDLDFVRDEKTNEIIVYRKIRLGKKTFSAPSNILDDVGSSADGTKEILALFGEKVFDTCKPLKLAERLIELVTWEDKSAFVLDFFAGSGTTAHGVIELNKQDNGRRKFILVDFADFIDSITLARLKKVAYSLDWKDGKPQSTNSLGIFVKYHYVEQYEDTLSNIVFLEKDKTVQETLDEFGDYLLKNMLEFETRGSPTRLNVEQFQTPFDYKIWVTTAGEKRLATVDLVETFNYLLGITVEKFRTFKNEEQEYRCVFGKLGQENIAIIWRNTKNIDLKKDKEFIENTILAGTKPDRIFINGDSLFEKAEPIEPEFKRLMGA